MPYQDGPSIPRGSPLAVGWRANMVALLARHGLVEAMDVISAYAELCVRREPDSPIDPLDTINRMADPAFRRIEGGLPGSRRSVARRRRESLPRRVGRPSHDEVLV